MRVVVSVCALTVLPATTCCHHGNRYVHIGESHRGYLGTGSVDFDGLFKALAAENYTVR